MVKIKEKTTGQKTKGSVLLVNQQYQKFNAIVSTMNPSNIPIATYREMLDDAGILFPLMILKLPIARNEWTYINPDEDIQKFVRLNLEAIWPHLITMMLTSLEFGFSIFEKRFIVQDGMYYYKRFVDLVPDYIKINITKDGSLAGFTQTFPGENGVTIPAWKTFLATHNKRFGNYYGRSRLKTAHRYWRLDTSAYNYHAMAQQDFSLPTVIGRAPSGQTPVSYDENNNPVNRWNLDIIQEVAESLHSRTAVSFPFGDEWSLGYLTEKKVMNWDFNKDHQHADSMKAKAIFVPGEILVEGKGGSFAKAEVHSLWLARGIESIMYNLAREYIMPYLVRPLVMLNFYDGKKIPPLGLFKFEPLADKDRDFLQDFFLQTFVSDDYDIDFERLGAQFNIPLKRKGQKENFSLVNKLISSLKSKDNFSESDRKLVQTELRRVYNEGLERAKRTQSFSGYIPMPSLDLNVLGQSSKMVCERIKDFTKSLRPELVIKFAQEHFNNEKQLALQLGGVSAEKFIKESEGNADIKLKDKVKRRK